MKIHTDSIQKFYLHYPCSVALVVVKSKDKENCMAAAWHTQVSFDPPLYVVAIAPKRFTYKLIREAKEFSANFFDINNLLRLHGPGRTKGVDTDKFEKFKLTKEKALKIKSSIINESYASYECLVEDEKNCGDHTLFIGRIVAIHYEQDFLTNEGLLNPQKLSPILYLGNNNYVTLDPKTWKTMPGEL